MSQIVHIFTQPESDLYLLLVTILRSSGDAFIVDSLFLFTRPGLVTLSTAHAGIVDNFQKILLRAHGNFEQQNGV
jgi:hypothetical protein